MSFNLQPKLSNEIVLIRPLNRDDFHALYSVASDPLIWEQHNTQDRWKPDGFLNFFDESLNSNGALVIIDNSNQEIIGSSRYKLCPNSDRAVEIGWSFLSRKYWGGIFNKSFKTLMLDHAFGYFEFVLFLIAFDNIRSQRATIKLGGRKINDDELAYLKDKIDTHYTFVIEKSKWNRY